MRNAHHEIGKWARPKPRREGKTRRRYRRHRPLCLLTILLILPLARGPSHERRARRMDGGHVEKTRQKPSHSKMRCACSSRSICSGTASTDGQRCTQVEKTKSENGSRSGEHPGHRLQDRHGLLLTSYKNQLHGPCQPRAAAHAPQQQAGQGSASCFFYF